MNAAQLAHHLGTSRQAVLRAAANGRLSRSVRRDDTGRVVDFDPAEAAREWEANRTQPPRQIAAQPAAVAEVAERLKDVVVANHDEERRYRLQLVPFVVEGAAEALRRQGRVPTATALAEALHLEPGDEDAGVDILVALDEILESGPAAGQRRFAAARGVGRAAVLHQECE
jgi:hypothetical protein